LELAVHGVVELQPLPAVLEHEEVAASDVNKEGLLKAPLEPTSRELLHRLIRACDQKHDGMCFFCTFSLYL
jgi:hypothetical protein